MSEHCPLWAGRQEIGSEDLPDFCRANCERLWDAAIRGTAGHYDAYESAIDESCDHEEYNVEHSHEGIYRPDNSALRHYSLVDACTGCGSELAETTYEFVCPYSTVLTDEEQRAARRDRDENEDRKARRAFL